MWAPALGGGAGFVVPDAEQAVVLMAQDVDVAGEGIAGPQQPGIVLELPGLRPDGHFAGNRVRIVIEEELLEILVAAADLVEPAAFVGQGDDVVVLQSRQGNLDAEPAAGYARRPAHRLAEQVIRAVGEQGVQKVGHGPGQMVRASQGEPVAVVGRTVSEGMRPDVREFPRSAGDEEAVFFQSEFPDRLSRAGRKGYRSASPSRWIRPA